MHNPLLDLHTLVSEIKTDMEFLLSFAPAVNVEQVKPGLMAMFYITGSYEGDVELVKRVQTIADKYGLEQEE